MSLRPAVLGRRSNLGLGAFSPHTVPTLQWGYEFWRQPAGAISSALDISGKGRHATEATVANQPVNTASSIDSQNAAVFLGASSQRLTAIGFTVAQPSTIIVVGKFDTLPASGSVFVDGTSASLRNSRYQTSSLERCYAGAILTGAAAVTTWQIRVTTFNGLSSKMWRGGAAPTTGNAGTQSMAGVKLGAAFDNSLPLTGIILAAYCWSGAVSTADLDRMAAYLQTVAPSLPWTAATA